ncbi:MAG: galactitol-1-phosphate 5-dehydrogenase [Chloroflexi bacterium]|nr:galactitol-1-phosphate 5-dehydrogenase [Chloroflexota bacterium]
MQRMMDALVLRAIGDLRCEKVPMPQLQEGEALVRVVAAGICGSDVPRVYEHGTYRFPLIPGHEFSGLVEAVCGSSPRAVGPIQGGMRVTVKPLIPCRRCRFCEVGAFGQCVAYDYLGSRSDGAWAEYVRVPQENLVPLPEGLSLMEAALSEPLAVALHAVRQGPVAPGDAVLVLGAGPIGMMVAQWATLTGAGQVLMVDIDERKLDLAARLGLGKTLNARFGDPVAWAMEQTQGLGADVVVEAAGVAATVRQAIHAARPLGRVVLLGNPSGDVALPQAGVSQILRKQLTIRGSWNSNFAHLPVDEWRVAVEMMAAGRIVVGPLISHRLPLCDGPAVLERMRGGREFYHRVVLVNEGEKVA